MEFVSVFDMFKIGVGPSSSHTLGPWKAGGQFRNHCINSGRIVLGARFKVTLYGSLSLTGKGHATDLAVTMGLAGYDPETVDTAAIEQIINSINEDKAIDINGIKVSFDPINDVVFEREFLPFHANGLTFTIETPEHDVLSETYYSIGGGFILQEGKDNVANDALYNHPFPIQKADELLQYCRNQGKRISEIVMSNELHDRDEHAINDRLLKIWDVMFDSIFKGCQTQGTLPGVLKVKRRAHDIIKSMMPDLDHYSTKEAWLEAIRKLNPSFQEIIKWTGTFAMAVNEVNASLGRVVTSPTNGSAGVIPAVIMYYLCFVNKEAQDQEILQFMLTSGEIGSIFKKGSTISAAMGGCQAEIGVSSAMAAAGLAELMGGTPEQCTIAAEITMEHHLGMTCDPIAGLVQIPCIERNSMGAIKAINAAIMALDRNPGDTKVSLDNVVHTMWQTAIDMNRKYKETSEGGLATTVNISEC
ncbi:MAG: L-serine ammonia-lyase [Saprospiraceae bacterium]|nr:L-serine ammonia-lyase [Saprospiraceae bacterium]